VKIAVIIGHHPNDAFGGAEYQLWLISTGLARLGYKVTFIALESSIARQSIEEGVSILRLPGRLTEPNQFNDILYTELSRSYDVVLLREFAYVTTISRICNKIDVPLVFSVSSLTDCMPFLPIWLIYRPKLIINHYLNFKAISKVEQIVCQTFDQKVILRKHFSQPIEVIYNGQPIPTENITHSNTVIWVGNIKRIKRPEYFIKLAQTLFDTGASFVMVGKRPSAGRYEGSFRRMLKKTPPNFSYIESKSIAEVNQLISSSIIFASTSYMEGFPNVFIQAWMRRVPVISLSFDPDNLINKEGLGRCSKTFAVFANDVRQLIEDSELRESIGEKAEKYSKENLSQEVMVKKFENVLSSLK